MCNTKNGDWSTRKRLSKSRLRKVLWFRWFTAKESGYIYVWIIIQQRLWYILILLLRYNQINSFHHHHHWSSHIRRDSKNFKFPYSDLDSHWNLDLDTSWTIWKRELFLTCSFWYSNHHFWYCTCHIQNWISGLWYSESPWKMRLDACWTV